MDVGQSTADALWQQAVDGTFKMEPDAARRCAEIYVRFVETTVNPQLTSARELARISGFGDFRSAEELRVGFAGKASSLLDALTSMRAAAITMAAAHLRAARLIDDAEAANAAAIKTAITGSGK
ncbi:hypothetical protein [Nocardia veterana]|uniref:Uncharacterized protein n=1 Tax=Nocardia veterana TaxID=132249 RepID=A0A7X6LZ85_9NOCA|nr:hypothetical protein [Nocardia veterana]NKY86487.1 hypothetical protein [Nocardia veterana]